VRILVVEDQPAIGSYVQKALSQSGHVVDLVHNGIDGLHFAVEGDYQLIVLDVMLPGIDGFKVLERLRSSKNTPVIMVTAKGAVDDRVKGLHAGADDYIVKPFEMVELLARIEAIGRRTASPAAAVQTAQIGDFELDFKAHKARRRGVPIALTAKEIKILQVLVDHRGLIVSRTMLAELVWDMHFDTGTNAVEVAMRRLRAKVDDPFDVKLIETVRGRGYRIAIAP
jgi:two-component system, OmpR family, copper resistance phosphate regulon response regulator CusR